jgi:inner membrane protein
MQDTQPTPQPGPGNPDPARLLEGAGQLIDRVRGSTASLGKLALVGILMGLLLIPMGMVNGLIQEREKRRGEAEREVAGKWGGNQALSGPILTVPFRVHGTDAQGRPDTTLAHANFLPEDLDIAGTLVPEIRRRGIFEIPLFQADLEIKGRFLQPSFAPWKAKPEDILWDEAYLTFHVPDLRTVNDAAPVDWAGRAGNLAPENLPGSPVYGGLQTRVPMAAAGPEGGSYVFHARLRLNGSGSMKFVPMGKETRVAVKSPWATPSFSGAFLPEARTLNAAGFEAAWRTLHLSRSFPQGWLKGDVKPADWEAFAFGVDLLLPVDGYQKAERCAKYAVLFILLTFLVFFLYETFDRTRIHPLQYLLVGFALCLFYLLLLSLSEHAAFQYAYLAATAGTVGMITLYGFAILGARKRALGLGAMLTGLYGYLYTLLQMEDYALLMGSLGLFAIRAAVMFLTRKVDWYGGKPSLAGAKG